MSWARPLVTAVVAIVALGLPTSCEKKVTTEQPIAGPPSDRAWSQVFEEDFSGSQLDTTKLSPCFDWNYGNCTSSFNNGKEHYLPSQVRVSDGVAQLVAEPMTPPAPDGACFNAVCTYKSGLLSTARPDPTQPYLFTFTYGYVEARMKLPSTPGMFTAFWMLPAQTDYKYDTEIDIVENISGEMGETIYQNYAYDARKEFFKVTDPVTGDGGDCAKRDFTDEFHLYGMDWNPDYIAFYIDGKECGRFSASAPNQISDQPMQIIIDLMVDTIWQRNVGSTLASQTLSDHLEVDHLRVWQQK